MKFSTPVNIPSSKFFIHHEQSLVLFGSCFSQNIGNKLSYHKFKVNQNCFGTIFNPISIAKNIIRLIDDTPYTKDDFYHYKEDKIVNFDTQFISYESDLINVVNQENSLFKEEREHFNKSEVLIITLGTAWVYEFNETNKIVANCHKIPQNNFSKRLLDIDEIVNAFLPILNQLRHLNIIFTVSPVRHIKDGLHENNLSKSTLLLSIKNLVEHNSNCYYFPAYEIIIDELRDYRFYKNDLVHPTEMAVNYVWEKFGETFFSESTKNINTEINKIQKALSHKPFNEMSLAHKNFLKTLTNQIEELKAKYSFINFD